MRGHSDGMVLTAEQHSKIAHVYEQAAADMRTPPQHRAAFARKANWMRMLARIKAKKEMAAVASKEDRPEAASEKQAAYGRVWTPPRTRPRTLAERLAKARAERG